MAQNIGLPPFGSDDLGQIMGEGGVAVIGIVKAVAMIAHIDRDHSPCLTQATGQTAQIAPRSEQPVRQQNWRLIRISTRNCHVQHHGSNLATLASLRQRG
ncbi:hypothetical protein GCM10017635_22710 [Paracoccus kondratievae]|uniref:Uncharacterized protein n=1 Tax=Paracoccus kondratievae TaxID=135740 RepID=A0AAD3RUD5_9RHOB|nr:hypothetical protein GCM10017635_22710 [Paracoccus kondratievae]